MPFFHVQVYEEDDGIYDQHLDHGYGLFPGSGPGELAYMSGYCVEYPAQVMEDQGKEARQGRDPRQAEKQDPAIHDQHCQWDHHKVAQ